MSTNLQTGTLPPNVDAETLKRVFDQHKTVQMSFDAYNNDIRTSFLEGNKAGRENIIKLVNDILDNDGANITIEDNAPEYLVEFINKVKDSFQTTEE
jgi:hypothetical protein